MNALLNIQVNVLSRQAIADIRRLQAEMSRMQIASAKGATTSRSFGSALANSTARIEKFGKNLQWSGRQLEYNFTLPLVIAGGAATKWALENEKAMTRVSKVYGDLGEDVRDELDALERSFELLSNRFGVHLNEVMEIGAGWAQAGAAGVALAKATKLTLETMVIGEMSAAEATERLIGVQSTYRLNTEQLRDALAALNVIENQTAINFDGLIDVITRAGGAAATAGIDYRTLGAMAAALVPAAGTASQAGNSLRTMISRLLSPTKQAAELLQELGLEIDTAAWHSKNGIERLKELAVSFDGLTQSQKAVVSSTVASRWQINRFDILMRDLKLSLDEATQSQSAFHEAMTASEDPGRNAQIMAQELSIALSTNERSFAILTNIIRNFMAEAIVPLLPIMVTLLKGVVNLTRSFANLSPEMQQTIGMFLLLLAAIGPIGRYVGSLGILIGTLGHALHFLLTAGMAVAGFLFTWPGLLVAAAVAIVLFRDQIINGIVRAFNALPQAIQNALMTVVRMVRSFALAVYEWLSYLNPFARHSPSLVDNVTRGVRTILDQYRNLNAVGTILRGAAQAHAAFLAATSGATRQMDLEDFNQKRKDIVAVAPGAGPAVDAMVASIMKMRWGLSQVNIELQKQNALVSEMRTRIENDMKPMNDAIFENEMAQKRLRLEILKMEQDGGGTIDDMKRKYAELSGMIEKMTAKREDLRLAGAGSEITGTFDREIDALQQQRKAMEGQKAPIDELQKKLEQLQRAGEILQLERDIKFDPQLRELEAQEDKLRDLETAYQDIAEAIRDMESALNSFASDAAQKLARDKAAADGGAASDVIDRFNEGALGNFDVPTGETPPGLGREGGLAEIEEFNRQMEEELKAALDAMPSIDIWAGLKNGFKQAWEWIYSQVEPYVSPVIEAIKSWFDGFDWSDLSFSNPFDGLFDGFDANFDFGFLDDAIHGIGTGLTTIRDLFTTTWSDISGELGPVWDTIVGGISGAVSDIADELKNWAPLWDDLTAAVDQTWDAIFEVTSVALTILKGILYAGLGALRIIWETFWPVMRNSFEAVWNALGGIVRGALEVVRGVITMILALINGDGKRFAEGFITIIDGLWDTVYAIFRGAWDLIYGVVKGLFEGIISAGEWFYDTLLKKAMEPLFDALKRIFDGIKNHLTTAWENTWRAIQWVWDNTGKRIFDAMVWYINTILLPAFNFLRDTISRVFDAIGAAVRWVWDNVISKVWDAIKWYIDNQLTPAFQTFHDFFKRIWESIGGAARWVWDNVLYKTWMNIKSFIETTLAPAFHWLAAKIGDAWGAVASFTSNIWNSIIGNLGRAVNLGIDIINGLIGAFNWVTGKLGINITITPLGHVGWGNISGPTTNTGPVGGGGANGMPRYAYGTDRIPEHPFSRRVGAGFKTNNARAIVGEGNPLYPEYVIPTDPTHRNRALSLAKSMANDLGMDLLPPTYDWGGIIDAVKRRGGQVMSGVGHIVAGNLPLGIGETVQASIGPANELAKRLLGAIPIPPVRESLQALREMIYQWVQGAKDNIPTAPEITATGAGTFRQLWDIVHRQFPNAQLFSGFRPGSITTSGNLSYHAMGRAIDVTPSMSIFDWLARNYPNSRELIYSPANGRQIRNGAPHYYGSAVRADHWDHVHWAMQNGGVIPSLAAGGIVLPRPGGTLVRLGEAGQAEAVQPLPRGFTNGNTYNFYGDLSFPNITDPADAETFIANLEALV